MNQKELRKELNAGKVRNLYIFCSDDYYLKSLYLNRIQKVFSDSADIDKIELYTEDDLYILNRHMNETPLFGNLKKRLIYARLHFPIKEINIKASKNSVAVVDVMDCKRMKNGNIVIFDKPTKDEIARFIKLKLNRDKKLFGNDIISHITALFGGASTTALNLFLDKLLLYSEGRDAVTKKDVDECAVYKNNKQSFAVLGYLRNKDEKIISYADEILNFENPQKFLASLSTIAVNILIASIFNPSDAAAFDIKPYMYNNYYAVYKSIGNRKLNELIIMMYDLDVIFKTSSLNAFKELLKVRLFNWLYEK